jgi:fatty acid metabolism transcriptional regulator FadR
MAKLHMAAKGKKPIPFEPVKKLRVADQVAESIRDAILGAEFNPGDPLPSERELAFRFGVNRSSIREALNRLEAWGLIDIRQGGSTLVRNFLISAGLQVLPYLVAPGGKLDPDLLSDLLSIRVMLAAWTAQQAATRAGPEDVARLEAIVSAMEQPGVKADRLQVLDFDFYQELVRLTDNRVLALMVNAIRQVYFQKTELFSAMFHPDRFDTTFHHKITKAVARGDEKRAAAAMEQYARKAITVLGLEKKPPGRRTRRK